MLIALFLVIVKVFYIQVFEYKKLNKLASDLWSRNLEIEADRGKILDRNGVVLSDNLTTSSLVLIPNQMKDKKKVTKELSSILGISYNEMKKHVYKKTSIERVHPEGRRLSYDVAKKISDIKIDGVYLVKEAKRNYPYKDFLAHVLGIESVMNMVFFIGFCFALVIIFGLTQSISKLSQQVKILTQKVALLEKDNENK